MHCTTLPAYKEALCKAQHVQLGEDATWTDLSPVQLLQEVFYSLEAGHPVDVDLLFLSAASKVKKLRQVSCHLSLLLCPLGSTSITREIPVNSLSEIW